MARPHSAALAWPQASAGWVASPGEVASPGWLPPADQAAGLRHLFGGEPLRRLRVLSVTGGSVGSGKSAIVAELARHAAPSARVLVLDQTANEVARHAGVTVRHDLFDVVSGRLALDAVAVRSGNWRLLPAQRGLRKLASAGSAGEELYCAFLRLREPVSLLLINLDDQAGAQPQLTAAGGEVLLVITPGHAALTAAYARIKELASAAARHRAPGAPAARCTIRVLVNGAAHYADARRVFRVLFETARNFLDIEPVYAGFLPPERSGMPFGCSRQAPLPACAAALARLAAALRAWRLPEYGLPEIHALE